MGYLNNRGSTLFEVLLSFSVMTVVVSIMPLCFLLLLDNKNGEESVQRLEWEVFSSQIKKEIRMSQSIQVSPERIFLTRDGKMIIYEKYGSQIRRRVDFTGHETLLQNIQSVHFEKISNGVRVSVNDINQQAFTVAIYSFIKVEVKE